MWGRRGNVAQEFGRDLPGGPRRDTPLPRWIGRTDAVRPYEVVELEPLEEGEDATDDRQAVSLSLPAAVIEWLELKSEDLELTVDEVVALAVELQMPAGARVP